MSQSSWLTRWHLCQQNCNPRVFRGGGSGFDSPRRPITHTAPPPAAARIPGPSVSTAARRGRAPSEDAAGAPGPSQAGSAVGSFSSGEQRLWTLLVKRKALLDAIRQDEERSRKTRFPKTEAGILLGRGGKERRDEPARPQSRARALARRRALAAVRSPPHHTRARSSPHAAAAAAAGRPPDPGKPSGMHGDSDNTGARIT